MNSSPNGIDFMKALDVLMPYKKQLEEIHASYLDGDFDLDSGTNVTDPYAVITSYLCSPSYTGLHVKSIREQLASSIRLLDIYDDSFQTILDIETKHGTTCPYEFNGNWDLREVYMYLLHLFRRNDPVIIDNSIINGEILGILKCLLIRI